MSNDSKPRVWKQWTPQEIQVMRDAFDDGLGRTHVANVLGRTPEAVNAMAKRLKIRRRQLNATNRAVAARFWAGVDKGDGDGCWEWIRYRDHRGYGQIGIRNKVKAAHRVAYELEVGPIPDGLHLMHSCDNPGCVRPSHLTPGTALENMADCVVKGRMPRGEARGTAKLTNAQAAEIKRRLADGERIAHLAREFGVSSGAVHNIKTGKAWRWL